MPSDAYQIFKATYSGIPVYEMMCKGVAVMRRRADSWLNATQILKVAGFDKPQRTRVLEREVQKGEHEKVQGGYGKYQGTWIPLERGLQLAKQYNCDHILRPIIEFQPAAKSPPLAPKHLANNNTGRPVRRTGTEVHKPVDVEVDSIADIVSTRGSDDGSMTPSPSEASSSSRTPSPLGSASDAEHASHGGYNGAGEEWSPSPAGGRRRRSRRFHDDESDGEAPYSNGVDTRSYGDQILEYFISDQNKIPEILVNPPPDLDPNMAIDDDGHTALHWACAMGRIRIVKLLLTAGADIFKVNKAGQTALMRSVMFANNYDVRKFPELYEHLHRSTLNIDNANRTVFHHIVDVAMSKNKTHAARYYMETVLGRLSDFPRELADIINFQDEDGETALTMAARCRSKRLVKILIDHGADPKIQNRDGKSTEDYILEDEQFRASPVIPSRALAMSFRAQQAAYPPLPLPPQNYSFAPSHGDKPPLHYSVAAQKASTRSINDMTSMLDSLAASFDQELRDKERDLNQAHALLSNIQAEILDSQRSVGQLKVQAQGIQEATQTLSKLEEELSAKMGKRYRLGWEKWVKDEEAREKVIRNNAGGELALVPGSQVYTADDHMEPIGMNGSVDGIGESRLGKRKAPIQEEVNDLLSLYAEIPSDPEAVKAACKASREDIGRHRKKRKEMFNELVAFQATAGTGGRMNDYRRLIAVGCGIPLAEVDGTVTMMLESLESEEPSSTSVAWTGGPVHPSKAIAVGS
ncbi:transcription factor [Stereum hirsutum FP-91666 SS1]|uniref:transcription factor n=1 Tax=Stereum hirsutum (strain FP-91666) TaxID=721885 RepID=UPI0004449CB3|nr:transcription factor [Stereum hirsutum FP-91666 SS1]EIM85587.1 transcription factor [Stereum hirsutum FP-91666 SS1]